MRGGGRSIGAAVTSSTIIDNTIKTIIRWGFVSLNFILSSLSDLLQNIQYLGLYTLGCIKFISHIAQVSITPLDHPLNQGSFTCQ